MYIDEIGTYDYSCGEDMVEFYRSKNWTFPEKKVWVEERKKAIEEWRIKENEGLIALRKAEKEAEERKKEWAGIPQVEKEKGLPEKEKVELNKSMWADQVEDQEDEMELNSWSGIMVREGVAVSRPREDKGKG